VDRTVTGTGLVAVTVALNAVAIHEKGKVF